MLFANFVAYDFEFRLIVLSDTILPRADEDAEPKNNRLNALGNIDAISA